MARILMVVRPSKGGAFGHVAKLSRELSERGHEVMLAGSHAQHRGSIAAELVEIDLGRAIEGRRDARAVRELGALYKRVGFDIVHAHGSKGGVVARLARAWSPRTPLVFSPHNYAFTNHFASGGYRRVYRAIETALSPLANRTLCVCANEQSLARSVGRANRTRLVYNGVPEFVPAPVPLEHRDFFSGPPVVACVTEFHAPKGVPTLIEAAARVVREVPGVRFLVAGDGPMRPEIEAAIARLELDRSVFLLGQIDWVPALLEASDVFAAPGWSESFPYAILEAMSAKIPIVATNVGGVAEAIEDGLTGRLVPSRDPAALGAALASSLLRAKEAEQMADAALDRVRARFGLEQMITGTISVYEELAIG